MSAHAPPLGTRPGGRGRPGRPGSRDRGPDARSRPAASAGAVTRPWVRVVAFAALAVYGTERWSRLLADPPRWRLIGLAAAATALVAGPAALRRADRGRARIAARAATVLLAGVVVVAAFPISGVRWHAVVHLQFARTVDEIGRGLGAMGGLLVPYLGGDPAVRLVLVLGAAVLLLTGAAVLAFAGDRVGDARRAAAAVPLVALAIVPATLVRVSAPALQGLLLFALLALLVWGERVERSGAAAAVAVACAAGVLGALVGPRVEGAHAWLDYRSWAGSVATAGADRFDWSQSYGPLHWPQAGHQVLSVRARAGDYWKAENLTRFDGRGWTGGAATAAASADPATLAPSPAALERFRQTIQVTIDGMHTTDVIGGSGFSGPPLGIGGVRPGAEPGTYVTDRPLTPGSAYTLETYSPSPSGRELGRDRGVYPWSALAPYLTLSLPTASGRDDAFQFRPFHQPGSAVAGQPGTADPQATARVQGSDYGRAVSLARRLAAAAPTPYAFVSSVKRYLDGGGYTYDQTPPRASQPLLDFLFVHREGYCQQFSGAMALLLRMGGVPARVAAGFTQGSFDNESHVWSVSDIDAHAWVEAWFPQYGWVKFDPTPTAAPARGGTGSSANAAGNQPQRKPLPGTLEEHSTGGPVATSSSQTTAAGGGGAGAGGGSGGASPWPWIGAGAGGAALVAAIGLLAVRGRRRVDALGELERALRRTGRPAGDGVTLAVLERRLASAPDAAGYVRALRLQRYGGSRGGPSAAQRRALRAELAAGLGVSGRLRAWWALPPRPRGRRA